MKSVDRLDGLHVSWLGVVQSHSPLTVAPVAADASSHKGVKGTAELVVQVLQVSQRVENAVVAIRLTHRLASILITFHSVFGLVGAFRLPIKLSDTNQVVSVRKKLRLYLHVKLTITGETR